jgi:hypothetical protein
MGAQMLWNGQGPIYFGDFDAVNGTPEMGYLVNLKKVGCANRSLTCTPAREVGTVKETCSGQRLDISEYTKSKSLKIKLEMVGWDRDMLAAAFYAESVLKPAGTVTGEVFPTVAAGDYLFLKHPKASSIVVTDSAGTPATLVAGTNYAVEDAAQGRIKVLALGSFVQPFKAAYSYAEYGNIAAFSSSGIRKGLVFNGKNEEGQTARLCIPKLSLAMSGDFSWISDDPSPLTLEGTAYYVEEFQSDTDFGPFMRIDALPN